MAAAVMLDAAMQSGAARTTYDHRLRAAVVKHGNLALAADLGIPRSTVGSWLARGAPANVVSFEHRDDGDRVALRLRARRLERQVRVLIAIVVLLRTLLSIVTREGMLARIVDDASRRRLLRAVSRASRAMPRRVACPRLVGRTRP